MIIAPRVKSRIEFQLLKGVVQNSFPFSGECRNKQRFFSPHTHLSIHIDSHVECNHYQLKRGCIIEMQLVWQRKRQCGHEIWKYALIISCEPFISVYDHQSKSPQHLWKDLSPPRSWDLLVDKISIRSYSFIIERLKTQFSHLSDNASVLSRGWHVWCAVRR